MMKKILFKDEQTKIAKNSSQLARNFKKYLPAETKEASIGSIEVKIRRIVSGDQKTISWFVEMLFKYLRIKNPEKIHVYTEIIENWKNGDYIPAKIELDGSKYTREEFLSAIKILFKKYDAVSIDQVVTVMKYIDDI